MSYFLELNPNRLVFISFGTHVTLEIKEAYDDFLKGQELFIPPPLPQKLQML